MTDDEAPLYEHTQIGYVTGTALATGALIAYVSVQAAYGALGWGGVLMVGGLLVGAVLFSALTVRVNAEALHFFFGPGFWHRRIPLRDVQDVAVVRNSAWAGWGIRYTRHGWLYNVSGLWAVELTVRNEGALCIGTDEPEKLKHAVDRARGLA
jgi:hypothetical protein